MAVNNLVAPEGQVNSYYDLDEIFTTTTQNWREGGKFYDNIFKTNPLFFILHEKKRKQLWDGGNPIMCNLQYGKNTTFKSYARYDLIDTTPQDNQTAAYYYMRQYGGSIVIDNFSAISNSGKHQIQSLITAKIKEAEMTCSEGINEQLWAKTPGAKDILSIPQIVFRTPSSSDSGPGSILGDNYSWWRNQVDIGTNITSWALLKFNMNHMYNNCSKGAALMDKGLFTGNHPDIIIMNQEVYEAYEGAVEHDKQYVDTLAQKAASMGFEFMKLKHAMAFWDELAFDAYSDIDYSGTRVYGSMYFLNSNFLHYYVSSRVDLKVGKFMEVANQDARQAKLLHYHALACSNRPKQGVLGYIDLDISA